MSLDAFDAYLKKINAACQRGDSTEHTHRPALKDLIETLSKAITATNEPKREKCGAPDYVVSRKEGRVHKTLGYIEAKDIGSDLKTILKSEQIKRYLGSLDNLIITDYLDFRWFVKGALRMSAVLAREGKGGKFTATDDSAAHLQDLLGQFVNQQAEPIRDAKELAGKMAGLARLLRDVIVQTFKQEDDKGTLHGQFEAFKRVLLHDLKEDEFADMYAQTIAYGLFTARCYHKDADEFNRKNAVYDLPKTNPFLRQTFGHIAGAELDERVAWLVDDLASLLRDTRMGDILQGFGKASKKEDPVVHFYETFLAAYDPKLRESRGVYYTPEPVVSYIVRSVDWVLRERFGLKQGLADSTKIKYKKSNIKNAESAKAGTGNKHPLAAKAALPLEKRESLSGEVHRCLILDPAAGTGTFLYEVIRQIRQRLSSQKGAWGQYVKDHLLPRVFGFELMMAPYAVCHMKLGLELAESGYDFSSEERLGVYLTNTLEEAEDISGMLGFVQFLSDEAKAANKVKRDLPIMVVLGNPPYSGHSANASWMVKDGKKVKTFIGGLVDDYYQVDGKPLGEKNPKWLQDDYVKFLRYGQHRIEQTGAGVLAFITNHGYIDNPTFRGMRQQLMRTFSEIYILDLHGNAKKKETCPDGGKDENVFDIQQGVSIGIFVKEAGKSGDAKVYHTDLWGRREGKYDWLNEWEIEKTKWKTVKPDKPFYLFCPQDKDLEKEYKEFWDLQKVFKEYSLGLITKRDSLSTAFTEKELIDQLNKFFDPSITDEEAASRFGLPLKDKDKWDVKDVRAKVKNVKNLTPFIGKEVYRPFDSRYIILNDLLVARLNKRILQHFDRKENKGVIIGRQGQAVSIDNWDILHITNASVDQNIYRRGGGSVFPLYLYPTAKKQGLFGDDGDSGQWPAGKDGRVPNLSKEFVDAVAEKTGMCFISEGRGDFEEDKKLKIKDKKCGTAGGGESLSDSSPHKGVRNDKAGTFGAEDVFCWIYGVFHSPQYRARYAEFLKIDFPRVPLPQDGRQFADVCAVGRELASLHLMESALLEDSKRLPLFEQTGTGEVEAGYPKYVWEDEKNPGTQEPKNSRIGKAGTGTTCLAAERTSPRFSKNARSGKMKDNDPLPAKAGVPVITGYCLWVGSVLEKGESFAGGRVYINAGQYFEGVEPAVWEFTIGGYQVCEKWLKDRRGRTLSFDDISHYQKIVAALRETMRLMADERLEIFGKDRFAVMK